MSEFKKLEQGFFNTLAALGDSLSKMVIVGGTIEMVACGIVIASIYCK